MDDKPKNDEVAKGEKDAKRCFVITPIGDKGSSIYRSAMGLVDSVIRPVFEKRGYEVEAAHQINESGSINVQIINRLIEYEFAVANLTGLNPNVMYELAVRHAVKKPLICLAEEGTKLPFDIIDERTIFYANDLQGVQEVVPRLEKMVSAIERKWTAENPITRGSVKFEVDSTPLKTTEFAFLVNRLDNMERTLQSGISAARYEQAISVVGSEIQLIDGTNLSRAFEELVKWAEGKKYAVPFSLADERVICVEPALSKSDRGEMKYFLIRSGAATWDVNDYQRAGR